MPPNLENPFSKRSSASIALMKVFSFLDSERIKQTILEDGFNKLHVSDYPMDKDVLKTTLEELEESKLMGYLDKERKNLYFYSGVDKTIRDSLNDTEWISVFKDVVSLLSASWPFTNFRDRNLTARWATYETYISHGAQLRNLLQEKSKVKKFDAGIQTAVLFNDAIWYTSEIAAHDEIKLYAQASLKVLANIKPNDQPGLERKIRDNQIIGKLGIAISAQGTGDGAGALIHAKAALDIVAGIRDWDREADALTRAICQNNLGIGQNMQGLTDASLKTWTTSVKPLLERPGSDPLDATWLIVNAALEHCHQGKGAEAEGILITLKHDMETRRPPRKRVLHDDGVLDDEERDDMTSSETGAVLRAMGHMNCAMGSPYLALDHHKRALVNLRATLGDEHFQTADCMYNVAQDLLEMGEKDQKRQANELLDEAIAVWGNNPWYQRSAARALWRKGRLLREFGEDAEAEEYLRKAMNIRKVILPDCRIDEKRLKEKDWSKLIYYYSR